MKVGLVLEGGAHRTIFSCGVMDALLDAQIETNYVIGSSAGITYGVSYVTKQRGRNKELLRRFVNHREYAGIRHMLNPKNRAYYNLKFNFDTIPNQLLPFDFDAFLHFPGKVIAAVTNIRTGEAEYLPVDRDERTFPVLQATCALPLLFKPIKIDGELYADGGVADSIPVQKALLDGCDRVIVVLTRERSYRKHQERMMQYAASRYKRKYPEYAKCIMQRQENYNACIDEIARLEARGLVYVIAPTDTLGVKRTERNTEKLMQLYSQGYAITMQQISDLRSYLR